MNYQRDKEKLLEKVEEMGIEFIHLQFTDIVGIMKDVTITVEQLEKALDNKIMFDGSSIDGFVRIEESDMYLIPDMSTFAVFPWTNFHKEARLICDVYNVDGTAFEGCPRNTLKKMLNEAEQMGYKLMVGPECEFFLFNTDEKGNPSLETHDDAGYFDLAPVDLGGDARNQMIVALKEMGFKIEASHHEGAPGQHEIDFEYDDALKTADNIMTFKMVVRIIAQRNGLHATFMPKPKIGVNGSGMHLNLSLSDLNDNNVFNSDIDEMKLSETAYYFLGGLLKHARAFTALTNPTVNSYKRLVPGYEAPVLIAWSASNRSPLVRIPAERGAAARIELRSPDPSANPYLALTATLKAGLDGIENRIQPPEQITSNIYEMGADEIEERGIDRLPINLYQALQELSKDETIKSSLGEHVYRRVVTAAKYEWKEYSKYVSQWELDRYLRKY